jgi:hypothetical protein
MELISTVEKAVSHKRESGKFIVIYHNNLKSFDKLLNAFIFYFRLNLEASLWDITEGEELLEKKCLKLDL